MFRSPFSHRPQHMPQGGSNGPQMGTPMEGHYAPHSREGGPGRSHGNRFQNLLMNFNPMQQMQGNPMMQQLMGNPYFQNLPFVGSLFGAAPGMNQPQQPQIGGPLPPTSI